MLAELMLLTTLGLPEMAAEDGEPAGAVASAEHVPTLDLRPLLMELMDIKAPGGGNGLPVADESGEARPNVAASQTVFELEWEIAAQTLVVPRLPDESQLPAFGHLFSGGYAAGYYSYKWAEVLAADAFAAFREAGLDDAESLRAVATRFRETVLGLGGSLPAQEIYRRFRGRDATPDALLVDQGLREQAGA